MNRFILFMLGIWLLLVQLMPDKLADIRIIPIFIFVLLASAGMMRIMEIKGEVHPHKKTSNKKSSKKAKDDIPKDPNMHKVWSERRVQTSTSDPNLWMKPRPTQPVQLDLFGNQVPVQNGNFNYQQRRTTSHLEPPTMDQLPPEPPEWL